MDNLIDSMEFPDERFKTNTRRYRPIGIGFLGLSDTLFALDLKYDSNEGRIFASDVMKTISKACIKKSALLAKEFEPFHLYSEVKDDVERIVSLLTNNDTEIIQLVKEYGIRNVGQTTLAPTGSTAISANSSYGMEPCFGLVYEKNCVDGKIMYVTNKVFEERFKNEPWYSETLLEKIAKNNGSLKNIRGIPKEIKEVFICAHDIKVKDRIDMQAALQQYVSSSISSTVNLPNETTKEEISNLYKYAYEKGLKGITIYRDGCKSNQPITFGKDVKQKPSKIDAKFSRPRRLVGETQKLEIGSGKLYMTINKQNDIPIEVILQLGKNGKDIPSLTEALGRSISVGLQKGVPISEYVQQFEGINSETPVWIRLEDDDDRPTQILSIPDAVAKVFQRYYLQNKETKELKFDGKEICPKCKNKSLLMIEGCKTCNQCNYSACS